MRAAPVPSTLPVNSLRMETAMFQNSSRMRLNHMGNVAMIPHRMMLVTMGLAN